MDAVIVRFVMIVERIRVVTRAGRHACRSRIKLGEPARRQGEQDDKRQAEEVTCHWEIKWAAAKPPVSF